MYIDVAAIGAEFISKSSNHLDICFNSHWAFSDIVQFCLKFHNSWLRLPCKISNNRIPSFLCSFFSNHNRHSRFCQWRINDCQNYFVGFEPSLIAWIHTSLSIFIQTWFFWRILFNMIHYIVGSKNWQDLRAP